LSGVRFEENPLAITGQNTGSVDLTLTLPTTRTDGTTANVSEIQSATILRDTGSGPANLTTINGPFTDPTVTFSDGAPASGADIYSFFCTDTAGTQGLTSLPISVTIAGAPPLAQLAAGTLTAVQNIPGVAPATPSGISPVPDTASSRQMPAPAGSAPPFKAV